jgi:hypothetical protein
LVELQGVDLSPYVDVLGVSDELRNNYAILAHVQAQRLAQQRVKSAKGIAYTQGTHFVSLFKRKRAQYVR